MLHFSSKAQNQFCDGISRRDFLKAGALGLSGLSLADLLRLRAQAGGTPKPSRKSVIMICLAGAPSHLDMYDLKPDAPAEYRGEFRPIRTNVSGLDLCELMPLQAKIADKLALVRNLRFDARSFHELHEVCTGFSAVARRPAFGSVVSRLRSGDRSPLPRYVSPNLSDNIYLRLSGNGPDVSHAPEDPSYVGVAHQPFDPSGPGLENLTLARGITLERLADRRALLQAFDGLSRDLDRGAQMSGMDPFTARALEIISSPAARDAFDLSKEPTRVRDLYGPDVRNRFSYLPNWTWFSSKFLLARRLVEAGVPVVTLAPGAWDHHGLITPQHRGNIFAQLRELLPWLDRSLYALLTDLHARGLDQDVVVVVWGEFGRSPRINRYAGRDHWPAAGFALVAGGGLRMGQVIGATDARGEKPNGRAYTPQNILATLYRFLGIDPATTLPDHNGRPMHLLDDREPISELT